MTNHLTHEGHDHAHGPGCGHTRVDHEGHTDFLHDGHLHNVHGDHVDEHVIAVSRENPADCTPGHACASHTSDHVHSATCGHEAIAHGDHTDYVVGGHLHHPHASADHCDDHGPVTTAKS